MSDSVRTAPIAVIGDLLVDEFVEASAHPSIETPPATIYKTHTVASSLGGAGLVALAAAEYSRGGDVHYLYPNPAARDLDGVDRLVCHCRGLVVDHPRRTRVHAEPDRFRLDSPAVAMTVEASLMLPEVPEPWGCVVLSDYRGMLTDALEFSSLPWDALLGVVPRYLVLDPHRTRAWGTVRRALVRVPAQTLAAVVKVTRQTWSTMVPQLPQEAWPVPTYAWITDGGDPGVLLSLGRGDSRQFPLPELSEPVVSAIGAGDVGTAALAVGLASGLSLAESCQFGHVAATKKVVLPQTRFPSWAELAPHFPARQALAGPQPRVYHSGASASSRCEVLDLWSTARTRLVERLRCHSGPVVVANGVFDGLHAGHQHLLNRCKGPGELLVVGLNSDASVQALGRKTMFGQEARAAAVASLRNVDLVVLFSEPSPQCLYEAVRPHTPQLIVAKGTDHQADAEAGRLLGVLPQDGVRLIPRLAGFSSTSLRAAVTAANTDSPDNASHGSTPCNRVR